MAVDGGLPVPGGGILGESAIMPTEVVSPVDRPHAHPGFFLVLDGPDGGGKTTQVARLADWLRERGLDVVTCRDPGGTALGNRLRAIVMERDTVPIAIRSEMLLFMARRAQMVEEVIRPAMEAGHVVVCDRFLLATIVYQGSAGGLDPSEIAGVGKAATGGLLPDLTIVLDVAPETARGRVGPARDRIEDRPADYQERVRAGYIEAANSGRGSIGRSSLYPAPIVLVDATQGPDAVFESVKSEVARVLALDPRA
jgi:dTMP kinase